MRARALVGWNVRRIRVDRGIPQEQLAYDAGIDNSYMSGLELGKANPTIDLLERIADTLGVPLTDLVVQPDQGATVPKTLPKGRKPKRPRDTK
ncbi:XRE family transcriptional regulator [Bradyrhizobium sp. CCBAU 21359]|uniref:helix-turn-helix domain-containing protein n=1 Tax=unclassified Bradyrhizobium TaxID=2631580 RepID=UPI0023069AAD|nr:helix-turn-helix transcriptional regulator [Bradyrhizobium sp. CCBAU 21359]MDA9453909.1 XRE family transcriptional regulator [Bradyrhizobium sp. CCBAU 21359]